MLKIKNIAKGLKELIKDAWEGNFAAGIAVTCILGSLVIGAAGYVKKDWGGVNAKKIEISANQEKVMENAPLLPSDISRVVQRHSNPQCIQESLEEIAVFNATLITSTHLAEVSTKCSKKHLEQKQVDLEKLQLEKQIIALRKDRN